MGFSNIHGNIGQISGWRTEGRRTISAPQSLNRTLPLNLVSSPMQLNETVTGPTGMIMR
jgi:hypothetical protein